MARLLVSFFFAALLSGCETLPSWLHTGPFGHGFADEAGRYSFDWRLSGDKRVAPVQVFDNGRITWLQFRPGQPAPAIFENTLDGERLLHSREHGDYRVLQGLPSRLIFRGGGLEAQAERKPTLALQTSEVIPALAPSTAPDIAETAEPLPLAEALSVPPAISRSAMPAAPGPGPEARITEPSVNLEASHLTAPSFVTLPMRPPPSFSITPSDRNIRTALQRWAGLAGWTFAPEHWAVDVDIPISAHAAFGDSFKGAVQDLLAATELAERPLQPCFYSNEVLRVVSYAQACNRAGGSSPS